MRSPKVEALSTVPSSERDLEARFAAIVGAKNAIVEPADLRTYEADALAGMRVRPRLVVLPSSTDQVVEVVRLARELGMPIVPRGAGTGLSGGALPIEGGLVVGLTRMNRILEVDLENRTMRVQPGVVNLEISRRIATQGYYYAPDPSSQAVCTIGGNVAENSGGAHCLKYGFTINHVLAVTLVTADAEIVKIGAAAPDPIGYDLLSVVVGSEGMLGIVTEALVRILRQPQTTRTLFVTFPTTNEASQTVSQIVARGIVPAAIEMMDQLAIEAIVAATGVAWPLDVGAALLIDVDGPAAETAATAALAEQCARACGALEVRIPRDERERATMWQGRKGAFAAVGRISRNYDVQDGVIPRSVVGPVLREIAELAGREGLRVANVFHAGDGNLHPLVLYDARVPEEAARAARVGGEILRVCLRYGGSITGEHGVGADKAAYLGEMFGEDDLEAMNAVRCAFDPARIFNPNKVFPTPRLCGDRPGRYVPHPTETAGLVARG
jgi:glycolate oxidase